LPHDGSHSSGYFNACRRALAFTPQKRRIGAAIQHRTLEGGS
jgi:hypothetical protein